MSKLTRRQQRKRDRQAREAAKRIPEFVNVRSKRPSIIFDGSKTSNIRFHDGSPIN